MKLSVIVPAYNAAETIEECLTAVFAALEGQDECEVIVVDDASTDDTPGIAARFPVELVSLESNVGRIGAREAGARVSRAERLLFVDTRVLIPPETLRVLEEIDYEPVVVRTAPQDPARSTALNRVLELIRKRVYAPYYPPPPGFSRIMLNADNFFVVPKGTGAFFVDRERFLAALPEDRSRDISDDTRVFRNIIQRKEIMIPEEVSIEYRPRGGLKAALRHLYQRGPRFADFHLQPGGRFYPLWVFLCFSLLLATTAAAVAAWAESGLDSAGPLPLPLVPILTLIAAGFLSLIVVGLYLAETSADFFRVVFVLPVVATAFGLGVIRGKLQQIGKAPAKAWNRWLLAIVVLAALALAFVIWGRGSVSLAQMHWQQLVPLALIHLGILAVNGLVLRKFVGTFSIRLRLPDWLGLAVVTSMGSYLATGAGGMMTRAAVLRHKFGLEYSKFAALLTAGYVINVWVVSILGLFAFAAYNGRTGFDEWPIPVLLAVASVVALVLAVTRPLHESRSSHFSEGLKRLHEGWAILLRNPSALLQVAGLLAINLVLQAAALRIAFSVFSFELEPDAALLLAALSSFSIFLAITPANLGIQEGFTAVASYVVGTGFAEGLTAMATMRVVAMINVFVLGPVFSYLLLRKR
jgi:hypothetical protein